MKRKFKIFAVLFLSLLAVLPVLSAVRGRAAQNGKTGIDVVIMIDTSGSMKTTDPNKIAIDAAKLFIDMLEAEGSSVGLVPFSDTLGSIYPMTELESRKDKEKLKTAIENLVITGDTDIGMAVKTGYEMLKELPDTDNQKALLFFTDGKIDLGNKRVRTDAISLEDVRDTVGKAAADGIPMYTIGLNADKSVDKLLLSDMAGQTGGRSYIVDAAESLPGIFNEIFADFISSNIVDLGEVVTDGKNATEIPFTIPNSSVLEANIILLTKKELSSVEVVSPAGHPVSEREDTLILTTSSQYHMVKLLRPEKGEWLLRVKGEKNLKIQVNLIFNYDIELQGSAKLGEDGEGRPAILFEGYFSKDGKPFTDPSFYEAFTAKAVVVKDGKSAEYPLSSAQDRFTGQALPAENGEYTVRIEANSDTVYRVTQDMTVSVTGVPKAEPEGTTQESKEQTAESTQETVGRETKAPETTVPATEKDTDPEPEGEKSSGTLIIVLAAAAALIVLLLLFLLLKAGKGRKTPWYGRIRWAVSDGSMNGREQSYDMGYSRGIVTLDRIITDPVAAGLDLKKIKLRMNPKTNASIFVECGAKHCELFSGFGGSVIRSVELQSGDTVMVQGTQDKDNVKIKVTYIL